MVNAVQDLDNDAPARPQLAEYESAMQQALTEYEGGKP